MSARDDDVRKPPVPPPAARYRSAVLLDADACWEAFAARDRRFDGRFVAAVTSTGIYCRPGCPARTPARERVRFYPHAAAARSDGFRACRRCRPDASPGTPAWSGSSATVARALRLIAQGALDHAPVDALAERLGVGARQLGRLFAEHVGAAPGEVARTRRVDFARQLLEHGDLPVGEVAAASGFRSLRRFHEAVRDAFGAPPSELRRARGAAGALVLQLPYRPPLDWEGLRAFLGARELAGAESFAGGVYRRTFALDGATGVVTVAPAADRDALALSVSPAAPGVLLELVARARRLFDLDADPAAIGGALARDPALAPLVARRPGMRVPGAFDPFETAVRAILGQQVSVAAATTLAGRLVARHGTPVASPRPGLTHVFPSAEVLAEAELGTFGIPAARAQAIRALAREVASGALRFGPGASADDTVARLRALPGFGPWTAAYVAMRACGEPDAFPAGDLGIRKALASGGAVATTAACERRAEAWRPWRAYAALHLWASLADAAPVRAAGGSARRSR